MGILNSLFGKTGGGKYAAAMNVLAAKYIIAGLDKDHKLALADKIHDALVNGGYTPASATEKIRTIFDGDYIKFYSISAMVFMNMNLPPVFEKCFPGGRWNYVSNPLIALNDAEKELKMARVEIFSKYQIDVDINK